MSVIPRVITIIRRISEYQSRLDAARKALGRGSFLSLCFTLLEDEPLGIKESFEGWFTKWEQDSPNGWPIGNPHPSEAGREVGTKTLIRHQGSLLFLLTHSKTLS
ncbi:hypothetical protein, partial [Thermofilum sp.]|uniref:hypothetical protein n=1 Tax=Thermofilum sp. TaxID=1961369 RepID=UPI0025852FA4